MNVYGCVIYFLLMSVDFSGCSRSQRSRHVRAGAPTGTNVIKLFTAVIYEFS